jgi:hypothetical protein
MQPNAQPIFNFFLTFPAGLTTGVLVALITLIGKYFWTTDCSLGDWSRRLRLDEKRHGSEDERALSALAQNCGDVFVFGDHAASVVKGVGC